MKSNRGHHRMWGLLCSARERTTYDRQSHVGRLDKALDQAPDAGWVVIDMAKDWNKVWPD